MCGIAGFCDFNKKSNKQTLANMTDVLHHRGQDDSGYSFYENKFANIGLGHRRLSILDLSNHGHQPMYFKNLEIVYNGEVYNFKEIRKELQKDNYTFSSDSDTEVILKAYHKWGIKAVDRFNGMFSIAIYDKENEKIVLIRDRAGVKPYYYYHKETLFMFASELKSFHENPNFEKVIDIDSLALYLQYGYVPEPHTIFKNTYKLKAGHYLEIDLKSREVTEIKYWDVKDYYNKPKLEISEHEAINKTEDILKSAFQYRMVSDVPVGVFLSGGYDSSLVTAILQNQRSDKLNTFTIGFKEKGFDEAPYSAKVSKYLGTNHTEYYCTQSDALNLIPKLPEIYDEPFGDPSAIPTILVSQLARKDVTVSLSADGGDEIFAGYGKYDVVQKYHRKFKDIPNILKQTLSLSMNIINPLHIPYANKKYNFETKYEKLKDILKSRNIEEILNFTSQQFTFNQINKLLKDKIAVKNTNFKSLLLSNVDDLSKMLAIDYQTYMCDDILTKVDRATMSVGLEGREPLLDHRLIEFVAQIPSGIKYKNGIKKYILKELTHKYLPKELMDRPKKGFSVPISEWFKDELKEYFLIYLDEKRLNKEGLFNVSEIIRLRDSYLNGNKENIKKLWFILMFEMWYEKWM